MLFRSFGQLILLAVFTLVLALAPLMAAYFGAFGASSQDAVAHYWEQVLRHQGLLQKVFAAIGAAVTFVGGALGVYKTWHYAEINLPARLSELVERWRTATISDRSEVIPALREIVSIKPVESAQRGILRRFLDWILNPDGKELQRYQAAFARNKAELRVLSITRSRCRAELVTTQLAVATRMATPDALNAFREALRFNQTDLDSLELMAKRQFALGSTDQALSYLNRLEEAATKSKNELRSARARRYKAEILHESETPADWDRARTILVTVIRSLAAADSSDANKRNNELALAYEGSN